MFKAYKLSYQGPFYDPKDKDLKNGFYQVQMKPVADLVSTNAVDALKEAKAVSGIRHPIVGYVG